MSFLSESQLRDKISQLHTKLLRQQTAIMQTENEIAHWDDQLTLDLGKKGASSKS